MHGRGSVPRQIRKAFSCLLRPGLSASIPSPILGGLGQSLTANRHRFLAFLPSSALRVECDVTHSKQTAALFLPGATTAHLRFRKPLTFFANPAS
jgi:hypothetical protein